MAERRLARSAPIFAALLLVLGLILAGVAYVRLSDPTRQGEFSRQQWIQATRSERTPMLRGAAEGAMRAGRRDAVRTLLGPPDSGDDRVWTYVAGEAGDRLSNEFYLRVEFDGDQVRAAYVHTD